MPTVASGPSPRSEATPAPAPAKAQEPGFGRAPGAAAGYLAAGREGPVVAQILALQRTAGNRAVTELVSSLQRDPAGGPMAAGGIRSRIPIAAGGSGERKPIAAGGSGQDKASTAVAPPEGGVEIDRIGVVDQDGTNPKKANDGRPGLNLRPAPGTDNEPLGRLADRDHVVAKRDMGNGWMYVVPTEGHTWGGAQRGGALKGTAGYAYTLNDIVDFDLPPEPSSPDPGAFLYRITANERAHELARRVYGGGNIETGQDQRFFTNVLKYLNDRANRETGFKTVRKTVGAGPVAWEKEDVELVAGRQIWIPSLAMAQSLKGTVSAGSTARDVAEKAKGWAKKAASIPLFIAGLIVGAIESIKDFFVGIFDLVWNAIRTLGGSLVDAAKAIWGLVTDSRKRGAALDALAQELEDLVGDKVSFLRKAYNWGRIVGYLTMEVVSAILLGGAIEAAKASRWGARVAKFAQAVSDLAPIKKISTGAKAIAESSVGRRIAELAAPAGKVAKKAGAVVDAVTGAPGRAVLKTAEFLGERAVALGSRYGWSAERLTAAAQIMEKYGVKLYLRKSSKYAPMRMAEGAIAKPAVIKANTLNDLDLLISSGFTEKELGLVAHFKPLPRKEWRRPPGLSDEDWAGKLPELEKQAAKRAKSFDKLDREMQRLAKPVKHGSGESYTVEGGLVKQVEEGADGERIVRPLTSDIDVFAGAKLDGSKLGTSYGRLDDALLEANFGEHGFHTEWKNRGDFDPDAYYGIIEGHMDDPLIEVGPDLVERSVKASEIPEVAEILNSSGYRRWKRSRMEKTVRTGIALAGMAWASLTGSKSRR